MTKRQALRYAVICFLMVLLGAYMIYKFWWATGNERFLGIAAFGMVIYGVIYLSISLTRIIIPTTTDYSLSTFRNKKEYTFLKKEIGTGKVRAIDLTCSFLLLVILAGTIYGVGTAVNRRERDQLKTFGRLQKVRIKDIRFKGRGGPNAFFDFYLNGKKYSHDLGRKNYRMGDSVTIVFSTDDPDIVEWWDYYDENDK